MKDSADHGGHLRFRRAPDRKVDLPHSTSATSSYGTLNDSELTCPRAPSLDPRLGITNRENHQLLIEQIVPVIVSHRKYQPPSTA